MSLTIRDVNHAVELSFSGDLNIYNIASIKEQVQKALEFATRVSLDLRDADSFAMLHARSCKRIQPPSFGIGV